MGRWEFWGDGAVVVPWRFDSAVSVGARPEQGRRPWQFAGLLGLLCEIFRDGAISTEHWSPGALCDPSRESALCHGQEAPELPCAACYFAI